MNYITYDKYGKKQLHKGRKIKIYIIANIKKKCPTVSKLPPE